MKEVVRIECEKCGKLFLPEQKAEAERHEKACQLAETVEREVIIGHPDTCTLGDKVPGWKYVDKETVVEWIKQQGYGYYLNWVERVYGHSPNGAHLLVAFWKEKIMGVLLYESDWIASEMEPYNSLEDILVDSTQEEPIRNAVYKKLRKIYEGIVLDNY
ncbi:MAG: hypothetical protein PHD96_00575 [Candidatus Pacebacteria bacterium]|nr:hypothetical protein [Candidatus Paceibacterota bacterium]